MSRIMIIAGEVSGDMHASGLVKATNQQRDGIEWFGIGGPLMRAEGVETAHDISEMAVMGFSEVVKRYPFFKAVFNEMLTLAVERRPEVVVLVDYPGFNLRLAAKLHELGIRVVYYICPQVWAWHRERIPKMAKIIDHLITIFPFEAQHFADTDLTVTYCGNPLVDEAAHALSLPTVALPWKKPKRVALLPGSRVHEIRRMLPGMWQTAARLEADNPDISFIVATPSEREIPLVREMMQGTKGPTHWEIVPSRTREVLRQADAAIVASGTATLETGLLRCPMVIVYKVHPFTYVLARLLVKIKHAGMVNIIAGREICPEFLQMAATPAAVANALTPLIDDTPQRQRMLHDLDEVIAVMGDGGASDKAAQVVLQELGA
ncbi:MAG: lipid-A-disaccharide synthase [Verrucomicrobia bacterium]|jgi:lipid-A-disaccharide synthase|nr:lipid-A-disaccharide synthase [Verrucomicrobiota bacterium]